MRMSRGRVLAGFLVLTVLVMMGRLLMMVGRGLMM
jgi:hypothetical protein